MVSQENDITLPKICIIGAGLSGICAAVKMKQKLKLQDITIFESNSEVGGNWLVNTYPGCACDVQSHLYSYSFALKPDWTKEFSPQPEILEYIKGVAQKFNVYPHIKFAHQVKKLSWLEKLGQYQIIVSDIGKNEISEQYFDIVINATGHLRIPQIPSLFNQFKGPMIHSARWNSSVELKGKRIAVIGSGATAIQLVPAIAKTAGKLLCYQRQPAHVVPSLQSTFLPITKWAFRYIPGLQAAYRYNHFLSNEALFPIFESGTVLSKIASPTAKAMGKYHLYSQTKAKPELRKSLLPTYKFGCKRVGISNKYYPALSLPHVKVITEKIKNVEPDAIVTEDGNRENIDILILATGFKVHDYFAPMEVYDRNGKEVTKSWKENGPKSYLGITCSNLPNHFMLLGPGSDVNHNSAIFQIECQVNWIIKVLKQLIAQKSKVVSIKESEENEYMKKAEHYMLKTVYGTSKCGSWFTDERGVVTQLYPKNSISYWRKTRKIDFSKFDFL